MATKRILKIKGEPGFPTGVYFKMISLLKDKYKYDVKKYRDWLEINPRSNYHQEMLQKKQALEQSVSRVMINLGDMRRDIELIKHDLRRLEEVKTHFNEKDEHVLKSDFVDLVDRKNEQLGLISLATTGKFPTIVVDFYKIRSEGDIPKLKVSQTEKGILKKKWRLYVYWKDKYGKEIDQKVDMLRKQLNGRMASVRMYKDLLEPYVKAIKKIRFSETDYEGFDDPSLIEGYDTSVAGVELYCWKGISDDTDFKYTENSDEPDKGRYPFYSFISINIKRKSLTVSGNRKEKMEITMVSSMKTGKEIMEIRKKIKERNDLVWKELEQFRGSEWEEKKTEEIQEKNRLIIELENGIRKILGRPSEGKFYMPEGVGGKINKKIYTEFINFYDDMKDVVGGLKFKRH